MKFILFLSCFIALSFSSKCPIWKCEPKQSEEYKGYCFYKDGEILRVGPFCDKQNQDCKLMDWYENGRDSSLSCPSSKVSSSENKEESINQNSSPDSSLNEGQNRRSLEINYQWISAQFQEKYCLDGSKIKKNWTEELQCSQYCTPRNNSRFLLFNKQSQCNYEKFVTTQQSSDANFNGEKEDGWSNCTQNSDCMSNVCECVPSDDGYGRCKSTYDDLSYEIFFNFVCEETDHDDYWDNACAYWINVQLGHFVSELSKNLIHIRCLIDYGDYNEFYKIQGEIADDTWWVYVIVISSLVALVISIYCCAKMNKKVPEKSKREYGTLK